MIFIDNKYTKCYYKIIANAKSRISLGYTEEHHIIPECFFKNSKRYKTAGDLDGNPDDSANRLLLTAKEHFICHLLLPNMVIGNKRRQMTFALWSMSNRHHTSDENIYKCNSRTYEKIKIKFAQEMSELHSGKSLSQETRKKMSRARTGTIHSAETKKKISDAGKNRKHSTETKTKISESNKGKKSWIEGKHHSEETKRKISEGNVGKIMPPITEIRRQQVSDQFKGTTQSVDHKNKRLKARQENGFYKDKESTLKKMSESAKNRSKYKCHCGKECSPSNYKRWHGDNCKN